MDARLTVPAGERHVLRLFALDMPAEQARFLNEPGAAAQMLGVGELDPAHVDIVNTADLDEIGLAGYLRDGFDIPPERIDRAALGALGGYVMILRSRAFGGRAVQLRPRPQLSLVAVFNEPATDWNGGTIETEAARNRQPPRVARAEARRTGAIVFAVVMALLVLFVIWIVA